jgi:dTDP-4-amino-4,6-dideoxygalactose transaminase
MNLPKINFIDLEKQQSRIRQKIEKRLLNVLDHGQYIMGPEIAEFEQNLSLFCGAKHSISCANGTDALGLILMAKDIKEGDAVFVPSFTFAATAEVVAWVGATPIFIDSDKKTFNMDPESLKKGIQKALSLGLKPKCIISVDLFGLPADYDVLEKIAKEHNLWILDDAAQGFGAIHKGKTVGNIGYATATSFFPAKPLGCYGDGGAIFTNDDELARVIKSLRIHGQGADKYDNVRIGMNGRLDTMQAAILIEKLAIFADEIKKRNHVASYYNEALKSAVTVPFVPEGLTSTWAQYTIILPENSDRNHVIEELKKAKVPTAIYYIKPLHQQTAYKHYPKATETLSVCEDVCQRVLSLPMHPYLQKDEQDYIIQSLLKALSS